MEKNNFVSEIKPLKVIAGEKITVSCKYKGKLNHGFFDLALVISEKSNLWFPDENTWNLWRDTGILKGTRSFATEWTPYIPDWVPEGEYEALALIYDDKTGKNIARSPIANVKFRITIKESNHTEAVFVRKLYEKFFDRKPDIAGYQTWFVNLQIYKVSRQQVLEIGFLRSPELKVRLIHKLVTQKKITEKELTESIQLLAQQSISKLIEQKYKSVANSPKKLHDQVVEYLKLTEESQGFQMLKKIEDDQQSIEQRIEVILNNFLLEKYFLIRYLFPDLSTIDNEKMVNTYLKNPEEIIKKI